MREAAIDRQYFRKLAACQESTIASGGNHVEAIT
jgi:hypothetical protein